MSAKPDRALGSLKGHAFQGRHARNTSHALSNTNLDGHIHNPHHHDSTFLLEFLPRLPLCNPRH